MGAAALVQPGDAPMLARPVEASQAPELSEARPGIERLQMIDEAAGEPRRGPVAGGESGIAVGHVPARDRLAACCFR